MTDTPLQPTSVGRYLRKQYFASMSIVFLLFAASIGISLAYGVYQKNASLCESFEDRAAAVDEIISRELYVGSKQTIDFELERLKTQLKLSSIVFDQGSSQIKSKCEIGIFGYKSVHPVKFGVSAVGVVKAQRFIPIELGMVGIGLAFPIVILLVAIFTVFSVFRKNISRSIVLPISMLASDVAELNTGNVLTRQETLKEFDSLRTAINAMLTKLRADSETIATLETESRFATIAKQVAHDIRSPLTSLRLVASHVDGLSEDARLLLVNAANRINDIANDLYSQSKKDSNELIRKAIHPVADVVDTLVSEKRMQYRDRINLSIHADLKDSYGAFAYFDAKELKRALSNLINNSAEAILDSGEISVSVKASETEIKIRVRDNGCGVPSDVIDRLGQKGFSYGKDSMPASGSGLGIWHAKRTVEEAGGNIKVKSREDGTLVEISLPKTPPPLWFIDELDLSHKAIVCILDDDMSIHNVWTTRIHSLLQTVHIQNFTSPLQFSEWYQLTRPANAIFLIDYEFLNQNINGLDLIEKLQISDRCVLVTSRSDDPAIQKRCLAVDQKMLPKSMAISIPIRT